MSSCGKFCKSGGVKWAVQRRSESLANDFISAYVCEVQKKQLVFSDVLEAKTGRCLRTSHRGCAKNVMP